MPDWGQPTESHPAGDDAGGVRAAFARLLALAERIESGDRGDPPPERAAAPERPEDIEIRRRMRAAAAHGDGAMRRLVHAARQDLTVIKGRAQLLRRRALAAHPADLVLVRGMEEIDRAVDRLERLLAEHLDPPDDRRPPTGAP
jgi:signal transduction histidine kinase